MQQEKPRALGRLRNRLGDVKTAGLEMTRRLTQLANRIYDSLIRLIVVFLLQNGHLSHYISMVHTVGDTACIGPNMETRLAGVRVEVDAEDVAELILGQGVGASGSRTFGQHRLGADQLLGIDAAQATTAVPGCRRAGCRRRRAPPPRACTCSPSRGNCTPARSGAVSGTGRGRDRRPPPSPGRRAIRGAAPGSIRSARSIHVRIAFQVAAGSGFTRMETR